MKNITKILSAALLLAFAAGAHAQSSYDQLAKEIAEAGAGLSNKKIAIIPFSYADGRVAAKDGAIISEKITMRMIKLQQFEIIERSVLDKVMAELKLQSSGAMDATSTKELGKLLGVEAIVTGTLVEMQAGKIEVNARLIKTETAQAIGASQVTVEKDWIGGDAASAPQPAPAQQPAYGRQAPAQPVQKAPRVRGENEYGYVDVFLGGGNRTIDITYENDGTAKVDLGEVGLTPAGAEYREVKLEGLEGSGMGPVGIRVGGFGKSALGGAFEFSVNQHVVEQQSATVLKNGVSSTINLPSGDNYLTMTSFGFLGNLFIRHAGKKVDPYLGMGLGLSLNRVQLPHAYGFTDSSVLSKPVDDFGVGVMLNFPVGMRLKLDPKTHIVAELRYELNTVFFDRAIANESDTISSSGLRFLVGVGFGF